MEAQPRPRAGPLMRRCRVSTVARKSSTRAEELEAVRRALRGPLTEEKRRSVAQGVSRRIKDAVAETIKRNRKALRELADY